jgi:hypothetical protein
LANDGHSAALIGTRAMVALEEKKVNVNALFFHLDGVVLHAMSLRDCRLRIGVARPKLFIP